MTLLWKKRRDLTLLSIAWFVCLVGSLRGETAAVEVTGPHRWLVRETEAETNGEGLRGPSMIPPAKLRLDPVMLSSNVVVNSDGKPIDHWYLLTLPRHLGETACHETHVELEVAGLSNVRSQLTLISSQPFNNQFLCCRVTGTPTTSSPNVTIRRLSWLSHPENGNLSGQKLSSDAFAMFQWSDKFMQTIHGKLKYNAGRRVLDLAQVTDGQGDCGTFAQMVKQDTSGRFEFVLGYTTHCIRQNGGAHAANVSRTGNFYFDGAGRRYGAESGQYVFTTVGTDLKFATGTPVDNLSGSFKAYNFLGYWSLSGGLSERYSTAFSTTNAGQDSARLAAAVQALQQDPPASAALLAQHLEFVMQRKQINSRGK